MGMINPSWVDHIERREVERTSMHTEPPTAMEFCLAGAQGAKGEAKGERS